MDGLFEIKKQNQNAEILYSKEKRPREFVRVEFDLSESYTKYNPYEISHQFKSLLVESVVGLDAQVYFKPNSMDDSQDHLILMERDSINFSTVLGEGFFYWPQQPGKKMTVVFMFSSEFTSGSYTQRSSGGVAIDYGTTVAPCVRVDLLANTSKKILSTDDTRKKCLVQNKTGADIFISGSASVSTTGANEGIRYPNNSVIEWTSRGEMYAICSSAGYLTVLEMD